MKRKRSLKKRIIFPYLSATLIIALIISSYVFVKTRTYARESLENSYKNSAQLLYGKIDSEIDAYFTASYMLSRNPALINMLLHPLDVYDTVIALNTYVEPTIQFVLASNPAIKNIHIYADLSSREIPSPYFQDISAMTEAGWYEKVSILDGAYLLTNGNSFLVICPIRNYYVQAIDAGYVCLDIDITLFAQELQADYRDLCFTLSDANGDVLYSNQEAAKAYIQLGQNSLQGCNEQILASACVKESLLRIPLVEVILPILFILVVFLVFSFIFIRLINRAIFSRLTKIMDQINQINPRDFQIRIRDAGEDEIGDLANCINHMSIRIKDLFVELGQSKDKEKRIEMEYLRAKIDPHFFYNILDTINWVALDGDTELVCELTHKLSIFYRSCLNTESATHTIRNEIENIQSYLDLQKIATSDCFDVVYQIDESLLDLTICDFILQPLVENAIVHGIKPLKERRGQITIRIFEDAGSIHLTVADNGIGLEKSAVPHHRLKKTHYGVRNINERIVLAYGDGYGVTLRPNPAGAGAVSEIILPK